MPELPEVETVVRGLRPCLEGRVIIGVRHGPKRLRHPWSPAWGGQLRGRRVESVERRAKWIVICLEGGAALLVHLGMTGQLTILPAAEPLGDHTHLRFGLNDGNDLRYRDIRRFGGAEFHPDRKSWTARFEAALIGPEPWDMPASLWEERILGGDRPVKSILLDQKVIAGLGNIYADESLHKARIHPQRPGKSLARVEAARLLSAARRILEQAIEAGGTTLRDYVDVNGRPGRNQLRLAVYGRFGKPCQDCGQGVRRMVISGRSAHYCPGCQPRAARKSGGSRVIP